METAFIVVLKLLKVVDRELLPHLRLVLEILSNCHPLLGLLGHDGELEPLVVLEQGQHAGRHLSVRRFHPGESWVAHLVGDLGVAAPVADHGPVLARRHHRLHVAVRSLGSHKGGDVVADVVDQDRVAAPDVALRKKLKLGFNDREENVKREDLVVGKVVGATLVSLKRKSSWTPGRSEEQLLICSTAYFIAPEIARP